MPKLEISEDTIKRTRQCHSNFYCLNSEGNPQCPVGLALCSVKKDIGAGMVIVKVNNGFSCNYSIDFRKGEKVCICPVRYEIYKRYGK